MTPDISLTQIENFFYTKIPLTQAMGVRVVSYEAGALTLSAPLSLNHNHLGTAFGGSLGALATLAGYGLIWLELSDPNCHVVIQKSTMAFRRPVHGDLTATCRLPDPTTLDAFKAEFTRRGKARIELLVTIEEARTVAMEFHGTFVAKR